MIKLIIRTVEDAAIHVFEQLNIDTYIEIVIKDMELIIFCNLITSPFGLQHFHKNRNTNGEINSEAT